MRLILDTHAFIRWLGDDPALSFTARDAIVDPGNEIMVSAASAMEVDTKDRLGRLPQAAPLAQDFEAIVKEEGFASLSIPLRHATLAGGLRIAHKDPFDRFVVAQSLVEGVALVSNEQVFDAFGVTRLW